MALLDAWLGKVGSFFLQPAKCMWQKQTGMTPTRSPQPNIVASTPFARRQAQCRCCKSLQESSNLCATAAQSRPSPP